MFLTGMNKVNGVPCGTNCRLRASRAGRIDAKRADRETPNSEFLRVPLAGRQASRPSIGSPLEKTVAIIKH
jgi:hypothetical protein